MSKSSSSQRKNPKGGKKVNGGKNGKKEGLSGSSFFTWFMVIALLGVWTSVAVVWFDLVDYEEVLGKLGVYDTDGDGDFDVDDAKILLGNWDQVLFYYYREKNSITSFRITNPIPVFLFFNHRLCYLMELSFSFPMFIAKNKKPKLFNKFDKTIKAELDAAEKLRKKGKVDEALRAFESLVDKYPQSPKARYGKAQSEDALAEKMRSNDILLQAINTYGEVAELPNAPAELIKLTLKRRADRQQFLGRTRGSVVTLHKLVQLYPEDVTFRNELGVGYLLLGDNSNAKAVFEQVLAMSPNDGFAKVHYGFILKAENYIAESIPYLKEGLESGEPGTDDGRFYFHLGDALQRVGSQEAYIWYEAGHKKGHFASVWQRSLYNVNGLKAQPWWTAKETSYTDLVRTLEANWKLIRDEGLAVIDTEKGLFVPEDENLREKGDWSQYTLWQQGRKNEKSCAAAPRTCALLERFPESTGCRRGQIKYSVMHPGTHVWPHTGPTNCRLRMHLGLVIPKEGCRIRCANDTRSWEEGKVLIFDDSFEHEVWQEANSYRLIFIVDVWHPELTSYQRRTLPAI
uniref:Protein tilB homolog n=1 Tax=Xenopus tropicalis TaxID=8364 RepID=A0A5S6NS04_XENTR